MPVNPGDDTLAHGAVSISTAAVVRASNPTRRAISIQPTDGDIYVGSSSSVTTSNGVKVVSGALFEDRDYYGDVYAIASSGTVNVRYWEVG